MLIQYSRSHLRCAEQTDGAFSMITAPSVRRSVPSACFNNNDPISFPSVNLLSVFPPFDQYKLLPAGDFMIHYLLPTHIKNTYYGMV